ncbi:11668_t:CDS:2, partial [Funneliformis caledonium]
EEYNYSCIYNTQTSTQQHHLNSVHKEFKKEKLKQLKVDDQIKKVMLYKELKQRKLRNALADWLVTDS